MRSRPLTMSVTEPQHLRLCFASSSLTWPASYVAGSPEISIPSYPTFARRASVVSIGSGRIQLCIASFSAISPSIQTVHLELCRPWSEPELSRINHAIRIESVLDPAQYVEAGPMLRPHVGSQLEPNTVMVVDDGAGAERGRDAILPDPVVQRDRVGAAVGQNEARVDHRAPRIPVAQVRPELEPARGIRLRHSFLERVIRVQQPRVGGDHVDRAPHGRQLGRVWRLVEVVAVLPPDLSGPTIEPLASVGSDEREHRFALGVHDRGIAFETE